MLISTPLRQDCPEASMIYDILSLCVHVHVLLEPTKKGCDQ